MVYPLSSLFSKTPAIGLDLGRDAVRMLQIEAEAGQAPHLLAAGRREIQPDREGPRLSSGLTANAAEAIQDLLRRGGFRGRRVIAALPRALASFKTVRVGTGSGNELPAVLAREAQQGFGIDVTKGEHIVHFLPGEPLRRGADSHQEGVLCLVSKAMIDEFVAWLHGLGAVVAGIDLEPLALYRSIHRFERRRRDEQDVHVLVDIASRSTQVVIGHAGRISFIKTVSIGMDSIHRAVAQKLDLSDADAHQLCRRLSEPTRAISVPAGIAPVIRDDELLRRTIFAARRSLLNDLSRELSLCLRYFCVTFKCRRPDRTFICGTSASDPQMLSVLNAELSTPVEPRNPMRDVIVPEMLRSTVYPGDDEWTLALGLALRDQPDGLAGRCGISRTRQETADLDGPESTRAPEGPRSSFSRPTDGVAAPDVAEVTHGR